MWQERYGRGTFEDFLLHLAGLKRNTTKGEQHG
jgi:hypothetical protein